MKNQVIYVANGGNTLSKDGSEKYPYGHLEQAKQHIRKLKGEGFQGNIIVKVAPGKYFFEQPVVFTEEDSGDERCSITYEAYKKSCDEQVLLSGAKVLETHKWEAYGENSPIKVAQIEKGLKLDGLVVNGKPQILCRYPNYIEDQIPLGSAAPVEAIRKRVEGYSKVEGGYIRALHSAKWGGNSYKIIGKDPHDPMGLKLQWVGDNNRGFAYHAEALVIENIFEELDAPGEWFYDSETGKLYLYPEDHLDLEDAVCEGVMTSEIFKFVGRKDGKKVKNIKVIGFDFVNTKRTLFTIDEEGKSYEPLLRGDWCVVRSGAILIQDAENITISDSTFENIGGNGIFVSGYNRKHLIENNSMTHIGASCIQVAGLPEAVYEPSFWEDSPTINGVEKSVHKNKIDCKEKTGPRSVHYPDQITISNNYLSDMGIFEKQSSGINLSISRQCRIIHNTIHKSPRSCININDGTFGGHEIAYNDIFDSQRETTDHGPFNSWGRDRFWSVPCYNASGLYGEEIRPYALLDAVDVVKIHDNRFHHGADQPHTWGIDLDDGSSHYEIYNNLCLGLGVKLREGFDRKVYNNIVIDGSFNIHCTYAKANDKVFRNIVVGNSTWEFAGQEGGDEVRLTEGNYEIDYNSYYNENEKITLPHFFSRNGYDVHGSTSEDPQFENTKENNYTVTNQVLLEKTGFKNFSMDHYGCDHTPVFAPVYRKKEYHNKKELMEQEWLGATITSIDEGIISSTASSGYEGVYMRLVPTDSRAYEIGLRGRDIIKKINQSRITGIDDLLELTKEVEEGKPEIEIFRHTKLEKI